MWGLGFGVLALGVKVRGWGVTGAFVHFNFHEDSY